MSINQFFAHDFQKHIEAISDEYDRVLEENENLRQRMQEWRKDEEIQKLEKEIKDVRLHSIHVITDVELDETTSDGMEFDDLESAIDHATWWLDQPHKEIDADV